MMMDDHTTAATIRRLRGQFATPLGLSQPAQELEARGLMKFHQWPSGHWAITDAGRAFLREVSNG